MNGQTACNYLKAGVTVYTKHLQIVPNDRRTQATIEGPEFRVPFHHFRPSVLEEDRIVFDDPSGVRIAYVDVSHAEVIM